MAQSSLCLHAGAREVDLADLRAVKAPAATATWFPVPHAEVADLVTGMLSDAGFEVKKARYALSRNDARMFSTLDLATPVAEGVSLSVGVRNSLDKSFPLGFAAGSRVWICDNLAFQSDLIVAKKHTRNGRDRFHEAICLAVQSLRQFQEAESRRVRLFRSTEVNDERAESILLRAYEQGILSHRVLPQAIKEWRTPSYEEFEDRTLWSLFNAFTTALGGKAKSNPQEFASLTMRLGGLFPSYETPLSQSP